MTQPLSIPHVLAGANPQAELRGALTAATLGEYEIYDELGQGGMATVFYGHDIALDRPVAIKVMSPALVFEAGMVERFKREARTVANLSHPHIIPIYQVRQTDRTVFFVMKFVDGRPLDLIIKDTGPLSLELVETILGQVAGALAYAHRKGVVHRDIKPANIMLDVDGWAVVTDFGIARVSGATGLTSTGSTVGTPNYMSPEQYSNDQITGQSDQYSLGIVAYEMLAGLPPYRADSVAAVMRGHLLDPVPDVMKRRPDCPPQLARMVARMMQKDPADRYPSIDEVVAELRPAQLSLDHPTRSQMITLAKSGGRRFSAPRPPTSPIPASKVSGVDVPQTTPDAKGPSGKRLRRALAGAGVIALTGAALILTTSPFSRDQPVVPAPPNPGIDSGAAAISMPPAPAPPAPPPAAVPPAREATPRRAAVEPRKTKPPAGSSSRDTTTLAGSDSAGSKQVTAPTQTSTVRLIGWVHLGTRNENAILYVNNRPRTPRGPSVRWWPVPAGTVSLTIQAEGCTPWEESRTVPAGDSIRIGYRQPDCEPKPPPP